MTTTLRLLVLPVLAAAACGGPRALPAPEADPCQGPPSTTWPLSCFRRCQVDTDCVLEHAPRGTPCHCRLSVFNRAYRAQVSQLVEKCRQRPPPDGGTGPTGCGEWLCLKRGLCRDGACTIERVCTRDEAEP